MPKSRFADIQGRKQSRLKADKAAREADAAAMKPHDVAERSHMKRQKKNLHTRDGR